MGADHPFAPYFGCSGPTEEYRQNNTVSQGENTSMTQDDYIFRNEDKIVLIQKRFKGVRARLTYLAKRNAHRNAAKHF